MPDAPWAFGRAIAWLLLAATGVVHANTTGAPSRALANMPVLFEQNVGQHKTGQFRTAGSGFSVAFDDGQAHILSKDGHATAMVFVDAQAATLRGEKPAAVRADYFRGQTKQDWRLNVPLFHQLRYADLYPGIDVVYYGSGRQLEYDFIVRPGTDLGRIRFRIEGAQRLDIDDTGALIAETGGGHLHRHARPLAYQTFMGRRTAVPAQFVKSRTGDIGFQVGVYDHSRTLIIDPVLTFSTYLGADLDDEAVDVATDAAGNIYVLGNVLLHSDAPGAFGTNKDTFLYKLSPDGTNVLYAALIGGTYTDEAHGLAVDTSGIAYITGRTSSSDFPISSTAYLTTPRKVPNAFLCAINTNAPPESSLLYSSYFPADVGNAIALDPSGNVYITGAASWGFTTTPGAFQTQCPYCSYSTDAFVAKFDLRHAGEASLVYSTYLGGSTVPVLGTGNDTGLGIVVDSAGEAIVTGEASSTDFPTRNAVDDSYNSGISDVFVAKLNASGTDLVFSTLLGTEQVDSGRAIALDPSGNIYVTGFTNWYDFPTTAGAWQRQWNANQCGSLYNDPCPDAFVTKLSPTGALLYSTYLGGILPDYGYDVAVDSSGNAYVTGHTISFNFPLVNPLPGVSAGANDAFITELNADGTGILFSTLLGGGLKDEGRAIALDGSQVIVAGVTNATDFPAINAGQPANAGGTDAFITKFPLPNAAPEVSALALSPTSVASGESATGTRLLNRAARIGSSVLALPSSETSSRTF